MGKKIFLPLFLLPFCSFCAGPGVPQLTYPQNEVFKIISSIDGSKGAGVAPGLHTSAVMHNGYLVIPRGGELDSAGFAFFDLSDPYNPRPLSLVTNPGSRESHTIGFSNSYPGLYAVTQGSNGIFFWDWTDVLNPAVISRLDLPGAEPNTYTSGVFWVFWQAPYVFVGGEANGIYIVDATNPGKPLLVNQLRLDKTGGFPVGALFAVGNLLVASTADGDGLSTFDLSDPVNPVLMATVRNLKHYSTVVNGDKIIASVVNKTLAVYDISDPAVIRRIRVLFGGLSPSSGGYALFQDGFVHAGQSVNYVKIDIRNDSQYTVVGGSPFDTALTADEYDLDFISVIGNLVVMGDDALGLGSRIIPHQAAPDTLGPRVNMVNPKPGEVFQALTTRIGITLTDQIDLNSVDSTTFLVRPLGGSPLSGKYSGQTGILNFWPEQPLVPNTTYEVFVPAGGIRDCAGNPTSLPFSSYFSTGATVKAFRPPMAAEELRLGVFAFPNPFRSKTTLVPRFPSGQQGPVFLNIYDLNGKPVNDHPINLSETGVLSWEPKGLAGGLYFLTVSSGNQKFSNSVLLLK